MKVSIKLRVAAKKDFLEFKKHKAKKGKQYVFKTGVPYWMINSKGKVENHVYLTKKSTDLKSFADYLMREQILILKSKYK